MNQDFTKNNIYTDTISPAPTLEYFFTPYLSPLLFPNNNSPCNWCDPSYQNFTLQNQQQLKHEEFSFKLQTMQDLDLEIDILNLPQAEIMEGGLNIQKEANDQQQIEQVNLDQITQNTHKLKQFIQFLAQTEGLDLFKTQKYIKELNLPLNAELFFKKINIVLIDKFTNLKKTKEEMIKFCMRKAFKHILDCQKKYSNRVQQQNTFGGKFTQNSYLNNKIKFIKKISAEKSMNSQFLRNIFCQQGFADDFIQFLAAFPKIIFQDNQKKIKYLAEFVIENIGDLKKIQIIRRLPWTGCILKRVNEVGQQLCKYSNA